MLIDEDIRKARTLPPEFYYDINLLEKMKHRIFDRSWHLVGSCDDLKQNNVTNSVVLKDWINEPIILTKLDDGEIKCFSNICTHRGMSIVKKSCNSSNLKCPYHGRTFDLNGKISHMPEFEDVEGFPSKEDNLEEWDVEFWNKFIFVNMNTKCNLETLLKSFEKRTKGLDLGKLRFDENLSMEYEINTNWLLYVDNYLEGFHIPYVHDELHKHLDYNQYHKY